MRRIPTLQPPVDLTRIRRIGDGDYATDGRWVLYQELPITNAESQTFVTLSSEQTNSKMAYSTSKLGKDRNAVYHGALRIAAADPSNFNLLDIDHPPELGLPRGLLAFDQRHIWRVDGEKVTSLEPTARQLEYLQRQLQKSKSDNTHQN